MAARHGKLCEFNVGVANVEDYKEQFLLYCTANRITGDDKKIAVLLTSMGTTTYTLLKNLVCTTGGASRQIVGYALQAIAGPL